MDDTPESTDVDTTPTFWSWLREQRHGALHSDLSEQLAELVTAVMEHEKVGSLTLQIKVSPTKDGSTVFVTDDVKVNVPKADRGGSIMFANDDGALSRRDPRQLTMPLAQIVTDTEVVNVDRETGEVINLVAGGDA